MSPADNGGGHLVGAGAVGSARSRDESGCNLNSRPETAAAARPGADSVHQHGLPASQHGSMSSWQPWQHQSITPAKHRSSSSNPVNTDPAHLHGPPAGQPFQQDESFAAVGDVEPSQQVQAGVTRGRRIDLLGAEGLQGGVGQGERWPMSVGERMGWAWGGQRSWNCCQAHGSSPAVLANKCPCRFREPRWPPPAPPATSAQSAQHAPTAAGQLPAARQLPAGCSARSCSRYHRRRAPGPGPPHCGAACCPQERAAADCPASQTQTRSARLGSARVQAQALLLQPQTHAGCQLQMPCRLPPPRPLRLWLPPPAAPCQARPGGRRPPQPCRLPRSFPGAGARSAMLPPGWCCGGAAARAHPGACW